MQAKSSGKKATVQVNMVDNLDELKNYVVESLELPCERVGTWLWVDCTSESKSHVLVELGFKYSKSKMLWWFTNRPYARRYHSYSMDEIRNFYNQSAVVPK